MQIFSAFMQESGRAGRDGRPAESVIYFNNEDLSRPNTDTAIKDY